MSKADITVLERELSQAQEKVEDLKAQVEAARVPPTTRLMYYQDSTEPGGSDTETADVLTGEEATVALLPEDPTHPVSSASLQILGPCVRIWVVLQNGERVYTHITPDQIRVAAKAGSMLVENQAIGGIAAFLKWEDWSPNPTDDLHNRD